MSRVCIDTMGPLETTKEGYQHILVIQDSFTRWVELYALRTVGAEEAAQALLDFIGRWGTPTEILSDRGSQFVNSVVDGLLRAAGIAHRMSIAYSKEENGRVERANKEVLRHLRAFAYHAKMRDNWNLKLPFVMRIMNSSKHSVTGYSPSQLLYGDAINLMRGIIPEGEKPERRLEPPADRSQESIDEWVTQRNQHQKEILELAKEIQEKLDREHLESVDASKVTVFEDGSFVLVQPPDNALTGRKRKSKLETYWAGPMEVIDHIGNTYRLRDLVDTGKTIERNVKELKAYVVGDEQPPEKVAMADKQDFEVEAIITHTGSKQTTKLGGMRFKVRWAGYTPEDDTWLPYKELRNNVKLHDYLRCKGMETYIPKEHR